MLARAVVRAPVLADLMAAMPVLAALVQVPARVAVRARALAAPVRVLAVLAQAVVRVRALADLMAATRVLVVRARCWRI